MTMHFQKGIPVKSLRMYMRRRLCQSHPAWWFQEYGGTRLEVLPCTTSDWASWGTAVSWASWPVDKRFRTLGFPRDLVLGATEAGKALLSVCRLTLPSLSASFLILGAIPWSLMGLKSILLTPLCLICTCTKPEPEWSHCFALDCFCRETWHSANRSTTFGQRQVLAQTLGLWL